MTARVEGALAGIVVGDDTRAWGPPLAGDEANPIELSDTPPAYRRRPPRLGEHTVELRAWLRDRPSEPGVVSATSASPSVPSHGSPS